MKLTDLDAAGTRRYDNYLSIGFSDDVFEKLRPYRENREAAGFVRLAVRTLLAVVDGSWPAVERVADELVCSCAMLEDLGELTAGCIMLGRELEDRIGKIEEGG